MWPPLVESQLVLQSVLTVIEAVTRTGAAGRLDVFPHLCGNKHIKLDLNPCVYSHLWLIIDLPVFFPELRSWIDEIVGGFIVPNLFSMCKAKLFL